jgi:hypothetical protein
VFRGSFIVPSFDEIWPQAGKEKEKEKKKAKRMGLDYILEVRGEDDIHNRPYLLIFSYSINFCRQCSTTVWVTCPSPTTSQPVAGWALRSNSTTTRLNAIQVCNASEILLCCRSGIYCSIELTFLAFFSL